MNKSILVGLVAVGLIGCSGGDVNDQPTDAVTAEETVVTEPEAAAAEAPAADAGVVGQAEEAAPAVETVEAVEVQ